MLRDGVIRAQRDCCPLAFVRRVWAAKYCASMVLSGLCSTPSDVDQAPVLCCQDSSHRLAWSRMPGSVLWYSAFRAASNSACCAIAIATHFGELA